MGLPPRQPAADNHHRRARRGGRNCRAAPPTAPAAAAERPSRRRSDRRAGRRGAHRRRAAEGHRRCPLPRPDSRPSAQAPPRLSGGISAPRQISATTGLNLANTFVQQHPDVSIEITVLENEAFKAKLATAMQSGSPPDIFQSWGGGVLKQYADAGLVQDLTPALQRERLGRQLPARPALALHLRRQDLRRAVERRYGRLLVQQGAVREGRHRAAAGDLDRAAGRGQEAEGRRHHPDRAGREGQVAGPLLLGLPGDAHRRPGRVREGLHPRRAPSPTRRSSMPARGSRSWSTCSRSRTASSAPAMPTTRRRWPTARRRWS